MAQVSIIVQTKTDDGWKSVARERDRKKSKPPRRRLPQAR